jgi:MFS transporter, DHA2 family, methylenomycin A resistance protein
MPVRMSEPGPATGPGPAGPGVLRHPPAGQPEGAAGGRRRRLILLAMCLATFMIQLDVTIVSVALPHIQASLGLSTGALEWVVSAYALSLAALIPVGGALGDRYGRKQMFLAGMAVFALGSAGCALSPGAGVLIASRAVQGTGGAAMLALTLSILTETFPPASRAAAIGTWAAVGGTGFGAGPVAGGALLTVSGWPSVFWVNVPLAILGIVGTALAVPGSRGARSRRLDRPGALLSILGLTGVTLGLTGSASHPWLSWPVTAPLVAGATLLAVFAWWECHTPDAMIPPGLLRARSFASASAVYLISYTAFGGVLFYVTLLYQDVFGWPVLSTGLSWLFMNVPFLLGAQLAGPLSRRVPVAAMTGAGCLTAAAGLAALSLARPGSPFGLTALGYLLAGAGFGIMVPTVTHVAMRDVPASVSGAASGALNASRQLGTSAGLAALGAVGAGATAHDWATRVTRFPPAIRAAARGMVPDVTSGRVAVLSRALGAAYRQPAAASFVHGYQLAVGTGAACLLAAAAVAVTGLRRGSPGGPGAARPR